MKRKRKILLAFLAPAVLISGLSLAGIVYLYRHPSLSKSLIEQAVSESAGANLKIADLAYSVFPFEVAAAGVRLEAEGKVLLSVPQLSLRAHRTGGLGEGALVIDRLRVESPSACLDRGRLPVLEPSGEGAGSLLSRIGRKLVGLLLFRRIELRDAELANGSLRIDFRGRKLSLEGLKVRMNPDHSALIALHAGLDCPEWKVKASAPEIRIAVDPIPSFDEPEVTGSWRIKDGAARGPVGSAEGIGMEGRFAYRLNDRALDLKSFGFEAENVAVSQEVAGLPPRLKVRIEGQGSIKEGAIRLSRLQVEAPGLFEAAGSLEADPAEPLVRATMTHGRFWPGRFLPRQSESETGSPVSSVRLSGPVSLSGTALGRFEGGSLRWACDFAAELDKNELAFTRSGASVVLPLAGTIHLSGAFPKLTAGVSLKTAGASFEKDGLKLEGIDAGLALDGTYPAYTIRELNVRLPVATGEADIVRSLRIQDGKAKVDAQTGAFKIDGAKIASPLLGEFSLTLAGGPGKIQLNLSGKGADLVKWPKALGLVPADLLVSGVGSVSAEASLSVNGPLRAKAAVSFSDVGFQDPDFTYTAQGIGLRTEIAGTIKPKEGLANVDGSLTADKGELLLGRFYFDLGGEPLSAMFDGSFDFQTGALRITRLQAGLRDLIECRVKGSIKGTAPAAESEIDLTLPDTDVVPLFIQFVKAPYRNERPFLDNLHPSGRLSADLRLRIKKGRRVLKGVWRLKGGGLDTGREDFRLRGVDLSLPVWVEAGDATGTGEPLRGRLSISSLRLPLLPEQSASFPLLALPNLLSSPSPVAFHALGGSLKMGPLTFSDLDAGAPRIRTSLTVRSVDVGRVLSPFWGRPVSSKLDGRLDPVLIEKGEIVSKGRLKADVFGGEVSMENIALSRLGAQWPDIRLNARIRGLNLEDLTKDTPFGKIEGVLRGKIDGLEVAYGQPQRFDLLLETVKKKGTAQRISLKAVDNISRLGGGGSPFVGLAGAFASLFKSFPYEKIGVAAHLENDLFTVNGTVKEEGREYLVKRAAFSGVNVINQNPDNRISFKDMLRRLKRVTSDGGGPVFR